MGTRLQGRVAVITGGCSGIGLATVKKFVDEGAKVVIGDVNAEAGAAVAEEVGVTFQQVDVTDAEQVEALFKAAFDTYGSVDIAFNNAGWELRPPIMCRASFTSGTGATPWSAVITKSTFSMPTLLFTASNSLPSMRSVRIAMSRTSGESGPIACPT